MFEYLNGKLVKISPTNIVIDVAGMEIAVEKSGQRVIRIGSTGQIID